MHNKHMSAGLCPNADARTAGAKIPFATLHIPLADRGWGLVMQSGVGIARTVGIPLHAFLREECGLSSELITRIDVALLDGQPVDDPKTAVVRHGARLALAAGLPGIAGLAMKSGSAVRGLRPGITFKQDHAPNPVTGQGEVELALFSLALPMLAGHFLSGEDDVPFCWPVDAGDDLDQRAFARAVFAGKAMNLTRSNLEADILQRLDTAECHIDVSQGEQRLVVALCASGIVHGTPVNSDV